MGPWDILILVSIIILVIGVALYFLQRWASKRVADQQELVERHKQTLTIYVIDKKKDKISNANFPKAMSSQMPRMGKMMKMPLVKAKIGPQIMTLICDKQVFNVLPVKKSVSVEIAGAYIVSMKGMKTKREMEKLRKSRRQSGGEPATESKWHEKLLSKLKR